MTLATTTGFTLEKADTLSSTQTGQQGRTLINIAAAHNQLLVLACNSGGDYPELIQYAWDALQADIQNRLDACDAGTGYLPPMIRRNIARHLRDAQVLHRTLVPHIDRLAHADETADWELVDDNLWSFERADVLLEQAADLAKTIGHAL